MRLQLVRSLRSKLILANILVFGLILLAVAVTIYNRTLDSETAKLDAGLEAYAAGFMTEFEDQLETHEFPQLNELEDISSPLAQGIRVLLVDSLGNVLFKSGDLDTPLPGVLARAFRDTSTYENRRVQHDGFRVCTLPVEIEGSVDYALILASPMHEVMERMETLSWILAVTLSGGLLLSALAVYLLTGRALRPMTRMVEAAESISASTLHYRLEVPETHDEVERLAIALNEMVKRLEEAFTSQRRFVSDASHELRTPLTIMYSELEFLRRQLGDEQLDESVGSILGEIDNMAHLVEQLLQLARIDAQALPLSDEVFRLDELVTDVIGRFRGAVEKRKVRFQVSVHDLLEIRGNAEALARGVSNVIDNAIKYSPDSGDVEVDLRQDGREAVLRICDHGPGIDTAELAHVFDRFYRSPKARLTNSGSGLGLAIARELIEIHKGSITLGTPASGGLEVVIRLPLASTGSGTSQGSVN